MIRLGMTAPQRLMRATPVESPINEARWFAVATTFIYMAVPAALCCLFLGLPFPIMPGTPNASPARIGPLALTFAVVVPLGTSIIIAMWGLKKPMGAAHCRSARSAASASLVTCGC
jgi:hypothetical protein